MDERPSKALPIAIVIAALIVGGSVYLVFGNKTPATDTPASTVEATNKIGEVSKADHILGNPQAPIVIIEYTDLECPYCRDFHRTLKFLMDDYGKKGELAWVVRHFPVPQRHPLAVKEHEAAECAAELGGNNAFFAYIDKVFDRTPSNNGLDPELLPVIAAELGLDKDAFAVCLTSGRYNELVKKQATEAFSSGAQGTPHNIVIFDGQKIPLPGAQPYSTMRSMFDALLARKNGEPDAIPPAQF